MDFFHVRDFRDAKSNHRKVDILLPIIEEEFVCAGSYRDALYFYSTDAQKRAYTFYRATLNEQEETIQFHMLRNVRKKYFFIHKYGELTDIYCRLKRATKLFDSLINSLFTCAKRFGKSVYLDSTMRSIGV